MYQLNFRPFCIFLFLYQCLAEHFMSLSMNCKIFCYHGFWLDLWLLSRRIGTLFIIFVFFHFLSVLQKIIKWVRKWLWWHIARLHRLVSIVYKKLLLNVKFDFVFNLYAFTDPRVDFKLYFLLCFFGLLCSLIYLFLTYEFYFWSLASADFRFCPSFHFWSSLKIGLH